jgi:hypothetical protein
MVEIICVGLRMRSSLRLRFFLSVGILTVVAFCIGAYANPVQSFKIVFTSKSILPVTS